MSLLNTLSPFILASSAAGPAQPDSTAQPMADPAAQAAATSPDSAWVSYVDSDTIPHAMWEQPDSLFIRKFYNNLTFQDDGSALFKVGQYDPAVKNSTGAIENIASDMISMALANQAPFIAEGGKVYQEYVRNLSDVIAYDNKDLLTNDQTGEANPNKLLPGMLLYIRPEIARAFAPVQIGARPLTQTELAQAGKDVSMRLLNTIDSLATIVNLYRKSNALKDSLYTRSQEQLEQERADNHKLASYLKRHRHAKKSRAQVGPNIAAGNLEIDGINTPYGALGISYQPDDHGIVLGLEALATLFHGDAPVDYHSQDTTMGIFNATVSRKDERSMHALGLGGSIGYDFGPLEASIIGGIIRATEDKGTQIHETVSINGIEKGNTDTYNTTTNTNHGYYGGRLGIAPIKGADNLKLFIEGAKINGKDNYRVGGGVVYRFR